MRDHKCYDHETTENVDPQVIIFLKPKRYANRRPKRLECPRHYYDATCVDAFFLT
jgi:hypothetical protein